MRFSIEAEQSVIGALLIDPRKIDEVCELITASDFYDVKHQVIFSAITTLASKNLAVDVITVAESSTECAELLPYLLEIAQNTPGSANVLAYAKVVSDRSVERFVIEAGNRVSDIGADQSIADIEDKLSGVADVLASVEKLNNIDDSVNFDDLLKRQIVDIDKKFRGEKTPGLMTGFKALDDRLDGLEPGDFWVLAARPSMGKTTLALNIAYNVAKAGKHVLIFSLEVSEDQMMKKLLSAASGISYPKLRAGKLENFEWDMLAAGTAKLKGLPISIIDTSGIDVNHAKNIAKKFARSGNLGLIVLDYLQLMTCKTAKTRFDEVSEISRQLKSMAKSCECPVLALSQLSRDVEKRSPPIPNNSDLRESGQIEQDADIISFIYREEYYYQDTPNKHIAMIKTSKFRNGEPGDDYLQCQLHASRFLDVLPEFYYQQREQQNNSKQRRGFE